MAMAMAPHSEAVLSEREAEEVRRVVDSGGLVDSAVMVRLLKRELQSRRSKSKVLTEHGVDVSPSTCSDECGGHLYLLDGFPRNWENHLQWQKEMASQLKEGNEEGVEVEVVGCLLLECSPEVMIQRCLARGVTGDATGNMEGRTDDRLDVIRQRLDTFRRNMDRVTEYYGSPQVNKVSVGCILLLLYFRYYSSGIT
jgi:adenylate kinase family enzyme